MGKVYIHNPLHSALELQDGFLQALTGFTEWTNSSAACSNPPNKHSHLQALHTGQQGSLLTWLLLRTAAAQVSCCMK